MRVALCILLVGLLVVGASAYATTAPTTAQTVPLFNYVVTILMENEGINSTYGSRCPGNCTYITRLADTYGLAEDYSSVATTSLPNYLTLTSGGNFDRAPFLNNCYPQTKSNGCYITSPDIVDSIENSGRTWRAYMEDYSGGGCSLAHVASTYENSHNPFVYYTDIYNNATRCSRIVNANPGASGYLALPTQLLSDLSSTSTASNYIWLTPNLCDDGHDLCAPLKNGVSQANQYLSLLVPKILNSTIFRSQNAALFITWDEGTTANLVTAIWAGPAARNNYKSTVRYDQYSMVKTVEVAWNLPSLYSQDSSAAPMTEFFLQPSLPPPGGGGGGGHYAI